MRPIPGSPDKTSQEATYPCKSQTKPHKMRPIPGNLGRNLTKHNPSLKIRDKTSQHYPFAWFVVGCLMLFRQAVQRPPAGPNTQAFAKLTQKHEMGKHIAKEQMQSPGNWRTCPRRRAGCCELPDRGPSPFPVQAKFANSPKDSHRTLPHT